ncbi:MAG: AbrB/MazE/SpoVT family DNA-binding domain-containing protein [Coriobacteriales bacterium]|jgi:AbrB family looped-hinge helix DNA binding protein|nr:AbrB/MazE/SpoVT family DNA-binding domain-containing protein [Coriobacteriales bacterium]
MELATVTSKGQITIPASVRKELRLKEGSKVLFFNNGKDMVIQNSVAMALERAQERFADEAAALGLKTDEDVIQMIKEFRAARKNQ